MESINIKDIPLFLHESVLYKKLKSDWDKDEELIFPSYCIAKNDKIKDLNDFIRIIKTCHYWMIEKPDSVYNFLIDFLKKFLASENKFFMFEKIIKFSLSEHNISTEELENFVSVIVYSTNKESTSEKDNYMHLVSKKGHIDALKFLRKNGFVYHSKVTDEAASNGHLDCLKYIIEDGGVWDGNTINKITKSGHLECLKYMFENISTKNQIAQYKQYLIFIESAIKHGHLNIVQYLVENSYSAFNIDCLKEAIRYKQYEIFEYLYEWTKKNHFFSSKDWKTLGCVLIVYEEIGFLTLLTGKHLFLSEYLMTIAYQNKSTLVFDYILNELSITNKIYWGGYQLLTFICEKDDLENLIYLIDKKEYPYDLLEILLNAIKFGSCKTLKYFVAEFNNNIPDAFKNNELLLYAININKQNFNKQNFNKQNLNNEQNKNYCLKILIENGCKLSEENYPKEGIIKDVLDRYFEVYNKSLILN